jgi:hypothetical protein
VTLPQSAWRKAKEWRLGAWGINKRPDVRMKNMKEKRLLKNEDGSVLVMALVMLVLLTLLGIAATRTSSIEIQVSGNERIYRENLYRAEAATMEASQQLEDVTPNPKENPPGWLNPTVGDVNDNDARNKSYWEGGAPYGPETSVDANTLFLAGSNGVVGSLDMSKSKVNCYAVYGRCEDKNGEVIIRVDYRRAF